MKPLIRTVLPALLVVQVGFAQWHQQTSGTSRNLNDVFFSNVNNGIAIGDSGTIIRTMNSGTSWESIQTEVLSNLVSMCFIDANNGWIVGNGGTIQGWSTDDTSRILHTTDGGANWTVQITVPLSCLWDVFFIDQSTGYAVGGDLGGWWFYSLILRTTNGGMTWTQQTNDTIAHLAKSDFVDNNTGWVISCTTSECNHKIYKSTNGGTTWFRQEIYQFWWREFYRDLAFCNAQTGIAVGRYNTGWGGGGGVIAQTTNGGDVWGVSYFPPPGGFRDVAFVNDDNMVVLGEDSLDDVYYWKRLGDLAWTPRPTGIAHHSNRFCFIDSSTGWAVGDNGTIIHTTNGGVTFVEGEKPSGVPDNFSLSQNYPNPFNPITTIRYALPHTSFVTLSVFNLLGQRVSQLVNEQQQAGYHDVVFRGDELAIGVYFYRIQVGNFVASKKLLLLK
jgi:photosystem II stability/assembly factor-like uncharacterized protein